MSHAGLIQLDALEMACEHLLQEQLLAALRCVDERAEALDNRARPSVWN